MRDTGGLPVDEPLEEAELEVVGHDIRRALYLPLLHEQFEVRHDLVFELLQPLVKFHVVLISTGIVILPAPSLAPVGLGQLESAVDLGVEDTIPFCGLTVESDGQDARLDSELDNGAALAVWWASTLR